MRDRTIGTLADAKWVQGDDIGGFRAHSLDVVLRNQQPPAPMPASVGDISMTKSELMLRIGELNPHLHHRDVERMLPPSSRRSQPPWRAATGSSCAASVPSRSGIATRAPAAT